MVVESSLGEEGDQNTDPGTCACCVLRVDRVACKETQSLIRVELIG